MRIGPVSTTVMMRSFIAGLLILLIIGTEAQELEMTASAWSPYVDGRLYEHGVAIAVAGRLSTLVYVAGRLSRACIDA